VYPDALLQMLNDGSWHRLESLADAASDPADAVLSRLRELARLGLEFQHDPELGWRLAPDIRLLDRQRILDGLDSGLRDSLACFDLQLAVDSTNSAAMEWLHAGNRGRALFLAEKQHAGRGRRGRHWVSPMARSVYLSLVWPVADAGSALEGLSLVTALGLLDGLEKLGLEKSERLRVKWPNDIWLDGAKLAGILSELHGSQTDSCHVVIGMGVNVHLPASVRSMIGQPVSDLHALDSRGVDRNELVVAILTCLVENLQVLAERGFEVFREQWQARDLFHQQCVEVTDGKQTTVGLVTGVSSTGALLLQTETGERQLIGGELAPSLRPVKTAGSLGSR